MANKRFWLGILVIVLVFGMTVVGCNNDPTYDDPTGTWDISISGQNATVVVTGNNYTFSGGGVTDSGTFTRSGNVGTLRTSTPGMNNAIMGYGTLTSNTTMRLELISPSIITGTFTGTKR